MSRLRNESNIMVAKEILNTKTDRSRIGLGLDALANVVRVTLGPRGRNVLLEQSWGKPLVTKDGASVAKEIELSDSFENLGAQLVKEVAAKTADVAGDGTTTAIVLAQAIFREGAQMVAAGNDPMELKLGIDAAVAAIVEALVSISQPVADRLEVAQVATGSANGDSSIGELIAEAIERVGQDGVVTVEEGQTMVTSLEFARGLRLDRGYLSPYFITDPQRMEAVLNDALVLFVERELAQLHDLVPLLEQVAQGGRPLLIVAADVAGEALATLVVNRMKGTLQVCAIKAPGFGDARKELLSDVATVCGGKVASPEVGIELRNLTLEDLGRAKTIIVGKDDTTFVGGGGSAEAIALRAVELRARIEDSSSEFEREKLRERLAKITGGVAVLTVGGASEMEIKEKIGRVEDALGATRAAIAEGIVPGGGVALLRALPALDGLVLQGAGRFGVEIVRRALEQPLRQIAENAGLDGAIVADRVRRGTGAFGYNAAAERYEDLLTAGICDPTKVVRVALQHAASVAGLLLTSEVLIAAKK